MKMKKLVLAVAALVLLSGCSDNPRDPKFDEAKEKVLDRLKDPGSAQFHDTFYTGFSGWYTLCGYVNSKNSMGGYVGSQKFLYWMGLIDFGRLADHPELSNDRRWKECQNGTKFTW